jgi:hypothetical protein
VYCAALADPVLRFATRSSKNRTAASADTEKILSILSFCEQTRLPKFGRNDRHVQACRVSWAASAKEKVHVCVRLCFCVRLIRPVRPPRKGTKSCRAFPSRLTSSTHCH